MTNKFVKMSKDGETIEVNPSVVDDHKRLGWKVVGEPEVDDQPEAEKDAEKAKAEAEKDSSKG